MNYVIEGIGVLVNPDEKHQYRNKGDKPFKMIRKALSSLYVIINLIRYQPQLGLAISSYTASCFKEGAGMLKLAIILAKYGLYSYICIIN